MSNFSLGGRLHFLLRPSRPALLYALRVLLTALLALLAAILLGLKYPHWAAMTTIVVAQPTRGAAFAKGFYRIVGSIIGAAAGVAMLALLRPYPPALILALALWVALCVGAANVLRGFRSYGAVLAAVTGPLVALLAFEYPSGALALGVTRVEEVLVGIVVSALVASLLLPQSDRLGLLNRAQRLAMDGLDWSASVLRHGRSKELIYLERQLVADMANLDDMADQVAAASPRLQARLPYIRGLMGSVLTMMSAARAIDLHEGRPTEVPPTRRSALIAKILAQASARLEQPQAALAAARAALDAQPANAAHEQLNQPDPLREHILQLERALREIEADFAALDKLPAAAPRGQLTLHRDWASARITSLRALLAICLVGGLWLLTGWSGGGPMLMSASIMCAIFATHPKPSIAIRGSLKGSALALVAALLFRLVLLPHPTPFYLEMLAITPLLFVGLLTIANRATVFAGTDFSMMFLFMAEPGAPWTHPPEYLLTTGSGIVLGVLVATAIYTWVLPINHRKRLHALNGEIVRDLQGLAAASNLPAARHWRARAHHRVLRLVLRAEPAGTDVAATIDGGLSALAVGSALLRLQQFRQDPTVPPTAKAALDAALTSLRDLSRDPMRAEAEARAAAQRLATHDSSGDCLPLEECRHALIEVAAAIAGNQRFFSAGTRR